MFCMWQSCKQSHISSIKRVISNLTKTTKVFLRKYSVTITHFINYWICIIVLYYCRCTCNTSQRLIKVHSLRIIRFETLAQTIPSKVSFAGQKKFNRVSLRKYFSVIEGFNSSLEVAVIAVNIHLWMHIMDAIWLDYDIQRSPLQMHFSHYRCLDGIK